MSNEGPREDFRNKSCVSGSWNLENDTDTRTNGQHYTAAYRRPTNQASAWQAGRGIRPTRPTRTTRYRLVADVFARMSRVCYAENGPVEFHLKNRDIYSCPISWRTKARIPRRRHRLLTPTRSTRLYTVTSDTRDFHRREEVGVRVGVVECELDRDSHLFVPCSWRTTATRSTTTRITNT